MMMEAYTHTYRRRGNHEDEGFYNFVDRQKLKRAYELCFLPNNKSSRNHIYIAEEEII